MKHNQQSKKSLFITSFLVFFLLIILTSYIAIQEHQLNREQERDVILNQVGAIRAELEYQISTTLNLTLGMMVFVSNNPDITNPQFVQLAKKIMQSTPLLHNIALAKDNVISHMYPIKGNEKALGLRYMETPSQKEAVLRAIQSKQIIVAGPLELKQGGQGIISRIPIFLDEQQTDYWGIASIVINTEVLYKLSGLYKSHDDFDIALRGKDSLGEKGAIFYGDAAIFSDPGNIFLPINLPSGEWILGARSKYNNLAWSKRTLIIFITALILSLSLASATYVLLNSFRHNKQLATYDSLTQLVNRQYFTHHLIETIARYKRSKVNFALLLLDLDYFKEINDSLGHPFGDQLLCAVAHRLQVISRDSDVIARLGGDEFIILQQDLIELTDSARFAQKILDELSQLFIIDETQLKITVSIGIVTSNAENVTSETLMKNCDMALYHAKQAGRSRFSFHDEKMTRLLMQEIELSADIKLALERNEFKMVYQPQINLIDNSLIGLESLIRWNHPVKGNISPIEFIPVAEKRGLISDIGLYGLHQVCNQAKIWQEQGFDFKKIALNISASHIKEKDFSEQVKNALSKFQLSSDKLELELTESIFAEDIEHLKEVMTDLRKMGITFAIDDFGTGYSSLAYLKHLEVTFLKIDQTFVRDMLID
ncbi:MAG: EAL domain-containing protein, partial [Gammaproteobacteria bacterium]|nr:EAL domain-containing protein [Gammaproteobacteria bacterium]